MCEVLGQITQGDVRRRVELGTVRLHEVTYPAGLEMGVHAHETGSVTYVVSGGAEEGWEREERRVGAGSVLIKRAGAAHTCCIGSGGMRTLVIEFDDWAVARGDGVITADGACAARVFLGVWRSVNDRSSGAEVVRAVGDVVRAMGRIRETAGDVCGCADDARWLIDAQPESERAFGDIAAELGVHPVSLARAFRRRFGVTMSGYRRRARVMRAAELLVGSGRSAAEVAVRAGFSDQSHMTRAFGAELGVTPGGYRRAMRLC